MKYKTGWILAIVALSVIGCGDDNVRIVRGINGENGEQGIQGEQGTQGSSGINGINGINGTNGVDGLNGKDGLNGTNGLDGRDGAAGSDGMDGVNGRDSVVEVIDPCGDAPNIIDEVLLRMPDGRILASVSENVEGRNTRFSLIPDGVYMTTDGSSCVFTVKDGQVTSK